MIDLELTRTADDRRLYALGDVGTLRLEGWFSRSASADAHGKQWHLARRGFWQRAVQAVDTEGTVVGEFLPRAVRRGGTLGWAGRELELRPASSWRERYALLEGESELALLEGAPWGRRPVKIAVVEPDALDPGLLLFAAFVVRGLATDADSAAGAGAGTVAASS